MRTKRQFQENSFYHIITRGNNKNIFLDKRDYLRFLKNLEKYSKKFSVRVISFALMPNHVHLLVQQTTSTAISIFMQSLTTAFVVYSNLKHRKKGHLFEGRFKSIEVTTDEYLVHLSRYIHLNPSSAQLVPQPEDYPWSSYRCYLGTEVLSFLDMSIILGYFNSKNPLKDYKEFVTSRVDYQKEISLQKLFLEH